MPEETTTGAEQAEQEAEASGIVHDDIMQRLLEYQRQLREGVAPEASRDEEAEAAPSTADAPTATLTEATQVVDITEAEAELEAAEAELEEPAQATIEEAEEAIAPEPPPAPAGIWVEPPKAAAEPEPAKTEAPSPATGDLGGRVAELEDALARVSTMVSELRERFQDMAIAADERLAAIEETLSGIGSQSPN